MNRMNADRSSGRNTLQIRGRTLAMYHTANLQDGRQLKGMDAGTLIARQTGQIAFTTVRIGVPNIVTDGCDCATESTLTCTTTSITNINVEFFQPDISGSYSSYHNGYGNTISWDPIPNGYSVFSITQPGVTGTAFELLTDTTANFYTMTMDDDPSVPPSMNDGIPKIVLHARLTGCPDISATFYGAPCFLAGALVTMADGSEKPIEDIRIGDIVLGAFGEHNKVLALHRPLLGENTMTNINNEHHTSSHHPHISADKKFYAAKPAVVEANTYGKFHEVLDENMVPYQRFLAGLKPGRVQQLEVGIDLKTVEGSRKVAYLENYEMSPDTQLYNLVLDGSHTYHVDHYAVTGWPKEDDFEYDAWGPR